MLVLGAEGTSNVLNGASVPSGWFASAAGSPPSTSAGCTKRLPTFTALMSPLAMSLPDIPLGDAQFLGCFRDGNELRAVRIGDGEGHGIPFGRALEGACQRPIAGPSRVG